jgi:hypothetical protein
MPPGVAVKDENTPERCFIMIFPVDTIAIRPDGNGA